MKQKFPLVFFFGMVFFVGAFFFSSVWQATAATGTMCTGINGWQGTCIVSSASCATTKSSSTDCGDNVQFTCCTNEPAPSTSTSATGSECATALGYICSENGCAGGISAGSCGDFGICCKGGASTPPTPSPAPSTPPTLTPPTPPGGAPGGGNRLDVGANGAKAAGLYIPTRAETGLSDIKVSALIQNLMNWLLYIVGFVAIIAFVISGIQYLLAGASEELAKQAKANMQYAIIGVIVALSALIIIRAVQSVLLGSSIF